MLQASRTTNSQAGDLPAKGSTQAGYNISRSENAHIIKNIKKAIWPYSCNLRNIKLKSWKDLRGSRASRPALFPAASLPPLIHAIFSFPSAPCTISLL